MARGRLFAALLASWVASVAFAQGSSSLTPTVTPTTATSQPTVTLVPTSKPTDQPTGRKRPRGNPKSAILFPFFFLALGAATMWLTSRFAPDVPYTVCMLVEGFVVDYLASTDNHCKANVVQDTLYIWANIQ